MIIFSKLGQLGRLGNQLFQIAATVSIAAKHKVGCGFPVWAYAEYFQNPLPRIPTLNTKPEPVGETVFNCHEITLDVGRVNDLEGYFQSEKNFISTDVVKDLFRFKDDFIGKMATRLPAKKSICAVHVRRGDYVNHSCYYQVPLSYYRQSMDQFAAGTKFLMFSDDIPYCKKVFKASEKRHHIQYMEGGSDIEDLATMTLCDGHIIANSSFSWWGAWLAEADHNCKIIAPSGWLDGEFKTENPDHDVVPDHWRRPPFEHKKIDLKDVTFTIPVKYDHPDRKANLELCVCYLKHHFDTNIIIAEFDENPKFEYMSQWCKYSNTVPVKDRLNSPGSEFHRTRLLNQMAQEARTPIVANWDADVFMDPESILEAVEKIRRGEADGCYPYDGRFFRVPRENFSALQKDLHTSCLVNLNYAQHMHEQVSYGGAIIWNLEKFIAGGGENEKMIHWGPEDYERYDRFKRLGFKIDRAQGALYHLDHYASPESRDGHRFFESNTREYDRIKTLPERKLKEEIEAWPWRQEMQKAFSIHADTLRIVPQVYNSEFYEATNEGAMIAADEIIPRVQNILKFKTVLDIGCGEGVWGINLPQDSYTGVDGSYVKEENLLIDKSQFIAADIGTKINLRKKFDVVISLEVAEHIAEKFADIFIDNLCRHSDQVLFSAAIPGQGGKNHLNEQWPDYWIAKFEKRGYKVYDIVRPLIWDIKKIPYYYRQNMLVFSKRPIEHFPEPIYNIVHPDKYLENFKTTK